MEIQWLGHSAFKIVAGAARVLFDPFLNGNPRFRGDFDATIAGATHVLLTHGHNDHFGDTVEILKRTGATLVSTPELCDYVESVFENAKTHSMNIGGSAEVDGVGVSVVRADHSSSYATPDGRIIYGGMPTGLILRIDGRAVYHMGDTAAFGDMALVNELHRPDIGIAPIGDNFTMGARAAALAVNRWFRFKTVIPCHYATFPMLAQSADEFVKSVETSEVWAPAPMGAREF